MTNETITKFKPDEPEQVKDSEWAINPDEKISKVIRSKRKTLDDVTDAEMKIRFGEIVDRAMGLDMPKKQKP